MALSRSAYFHYCLLNLAAASSFQDILSLAKDTNCNASTYLIPESHAGKFCRSQIDYYARTYIPNDIPTNFEPLLTTGNGNCFFNAISLQLCGTEELAEELRVRCVLTLTDVYNTVKQGLLLDVMKSHLENYLRFSGVFHIMQGQQYRQEHILSYLETEIRQTVQNNSWCGMLHFFAMSTALQTPILSVYPNHNVNIRKHFHLLVHPWYVVRQIGPSIAILWSGYINESNWFVPNHFVPLVKPSTFANSSASFISNDPLTVKFTRSLKRTRPENPLSLCSETDADQQILNVVNRCSNSMQDINAVEQSKQTSKSKISLSVGQNSTSIAVKHNLPDDDSHKQNKKVKITNKINLHEAEILKPFLCFHKDHVYCRCCNQLLKAKKNNALCSTCSSFEQKSMQSPLSVSLLDAGVVPQELKQLNNREIQMISKVHPYMKLVKLPVGGQYAQQGQMINFPVPVQSICDSLPKHDDEIVLLFSAKTNSNPSLIKVHNVFKALTWLKENNPLYTPTSVTSQSPNTVLPLQQIAQNKQTDGNTLPLDQERVTLQHVSLIPNDYVLPKDIANDNVAARRLPVLPGNPVNIFQDPTAEALAFPHLFPFGQGTFKTITEKVTWKQYLSCRLLNKDKRWNNCIQYIFWALNVYEQHLLQSCISTAIRVRSPTARALQARDILTNNYSHSADDFRFMKNMKGTNAYWKEQLLDLLAKMRLLGPPTFFMSLSSNDSGWLEMFQFIDSNLTQEDICSLSSSQKTAIVSNNPVLAALYFNTRWQRFLREFILGPSEPLGKITDYFSRIEFQNRGSPHVHAFFWVDGAPNVETVSGRQTAKQFIDKYISAQMPVSDSTLHGLVNSFQIHKHTHTCIKTNRATVCRFDFPRPISASTTIQISNLTSTTGRFYKLKRDEQSMWVNPYNKSILSAWQANMDIQMVGCKAAAAVYVCTYVCKNEPATLRAALHQTIQNLPPDATTRKKLSKIGNLLMTHRLISAQEATFRLLNIPMVSSSRTTIFINSQKPEHRHRLLKPKSTLQKMEPNSTDIFAQNIHNVYSRRPTTDKFNNMCLAHFATHFQIDRNNKTSNSKSSRYQLLGNPPQLIKERSQAAAFRTYLPPIHKDANGHFYSLMTLFLPWRHDTDILTPYSDEVTAFQEKQNLLDKDCMNAYKFSEQLEKALIEVRMLHEDIYGDIQCKITPNFMNQDDSNVDPQFEESFFSFSESTPTPMMQSNHNQSVFGDTEIQGLAKYTMTDSQYHSCMKMLSEQQSKVLHYIWNHSNSSSPLYLFITGGAGVGKSFLLKTLREHLLRKNTSSKPNVLVGAPTGVAAFNINGWTLHTLLHLDVTHNAHTQYNKLNDKQLKLLRNLFTNVSVLIIDEISMVSVKTLFHIHQRLTEICDTLTEPNTYFGGLSVIAFGDFYQLGPVAGAPLFSASSDMPTFHLWKDLFKLVELTTNYRQRNDNSYAAMLNRIRTGSHTAQDIELIKQRVTTNIPISIQHIYPKTASCNKHNVICTSIVSRSSQNTFQCTAKDNPELDSIPQKTYLCGGLPKHLHLCIGSRIMLIRNIQTNTGLVNGAQGKITDIKWRNGSQQINEGELPAAVYVLFDDPKVGQVFDENNHCPIAIEPITVAFFLPGTRQAIHRTQLPLTVAFGVTIHKVQGLTLAEAAVDIGKDVFQGGMAYVALSRVSEFHNLSLIDFSPAKIYPPPNVSEEMERMPILQL